jgi:hypothetical protein
MEEAIRQDQFNCVRFSWQIKFVHERESVAASGLVDTRERRYCLRISAKISHVYEPILVERASPKHHSKRDFSGRNISTTRIYFYLIFKSSIIPYYTIIE